MTKILLVEDDREIVKNLSLFLKEEGFSVQAVSGQKAAMEQIEEHGQEIDLVLLDVSLEDGNGFAVCAAIKANTEIPVIFLTASGDEYSTVTGLDMGADDYISKPFGVMELISRVKALLRRTEKEDDGDTLACGSIEIDNKRHSVTVQGETCELTFKEFELLKYLMINQGIVLSRDKLMNQVWGFEYEGESRTVDMHIKTLRHKLGDGGQQIKTVRNVGYVMEP